MSQSINHWKIGLLVVSSIGLTILLLGWLGASRLQREVKTLVCYFNESVQGLEVGSPVKMRGVMIGSVRRIGFASDRRHVEVEWDLFGDVILRLGLLDESESGTAPVPGDLRVQLATTGITGAKFLLVDFFDTPVPALPFDPPDNYVPSAPSTLKNLEDGLMGFLESLPRVIEMVERIGGSLADGIEEVDVRGTVSDLRAVLARIELTLDELEPARLSREALAVSEDLRATSGALRTTLESLTADTTSLGEMIASWNGLAGSIEAAVSAAKLGETSQAMRAAASSTEGLAVEASSLGTDMQELLAELSDTMRSLRLLSEYLERDPGALLRGRASSAGPPGGLPR